MISPGHRRRLNRALHELRRPLQALALLDDGAAAIPAAPPGAARRGLIELAASALTDLDGELNGGEASRSKRLVSSHEVVLAALERWRPATAKAGGIKVFWDAGPAPVAGDPVAMAQALDNLIANALEHGGPPLVVTAARVSGRLRLTLANGRSGDERQSPNGDPRRGHGVGIVRDFAESHAGRFALCETGVGCVAALELPIAESESAQAA
jgi:signal transduction histidine kinase